MVRMLMGSVVMAIVGYHMPRPIGGCMPPMGGPGAFGLMKWTPWRRHQGDHHRGPSQLGEKKWQQQQLLLQEVLVLVPMHTLMYNTM